MKGLTMIDDEQEHDEEMWERGNRAWFNEFVSLMPRTLLIGPPWFLVCWHLTPPVIPQESDHAH
jgi:hypothetical protein